MKVLVINWRDIKNPEAGGAEVHIDEILKRKPPNWQVDFVSASYPGAPKAEVINGYNVIRIPNNSIFNFTFRTFWKKDLSRCGYDLVIDDISKIPLVTPAYIKETPILAIDHHIHGMSLFTQLFFPMALYVFLMERFLLRAYKNTPVVAVSESTRDELVRRYGFRKIKVSHNGIDLKDLNQAYKKGAVKKPVILYFGRLKKYKRVEHIILAFRELLKTVPGARLWIAGKGDHEPILKELAAKLGLRDTVKFLGFVSERDKIKILSQSSVSAIASEKEGWGISVIESNAAGVPVVGYNVEGLRDSIRHQDTGLLVKNGDIAGLASGLAKLLKDKPLREKLSRNALKWAAGFSWDKKAAEFYKIAAGLVKRPRS
jgi:glycosyltransferase involved in cell wall biosynthesis